MIKVQIGTVIKNGTSLAIVIPANILRGLGITRGDQVAFAVAEDDIICIRKLSNEDKIKIKPPPIQI